MKKIVNDPHRRKFLEKLTWAGAASFFGTLPMLHATGKNNDEQKLSSILNDTNRIKEILSNKLENGK